MIWIVEERGHCMPQNEIKSYAMKRERERTGRRKGQMNEKITCCWTLKNVHDTTS